MARRLVLVCCTVGICASFSSVAFAQTDTTSTGAAGTGAGTMGGASGSATVTTAPAGTTPAAAAAANGGAPTVVVVEPPPDTRPKQGLEKPPTEEPIMFRSGLFGVLGAVSNSPTILPAMTVADHTFVGVGIQFTYNANGSADGSFSTGANPGDKHVNSNLVVAGEYMFIDKLPFALGPELTVVGSLAPDRVFTTLIFEPGVAFWYAPFRAPLVLGSALDAEIITQNGPQAAKVQLTVLTPGLRLGYIFN